MIKTSGYRVSPTEIEEVAYGTGLVRDAVALGVDDAAPRPAHRARRSAPPTATSSTPTRCSRELRQQLPLYMVPERGRRPARASRARPTASSTATCCARSWRRDDATERRRSRPDGLPASVGGIPLDRLAERVGVDAVLRLRPRAADRAGRAAAGDAAGRRSSSATRSRPTRCRPSSSTSAGSSTRFDVASAGEMRVALDTPMPPDRVSFAGPGQDRRPS